MSNTTSAAPATAPGASPQSRAASYTPRLNAFGIFQSEWIKLRSVRSTYWCYGIFLVVTLGIGALVASKTGTIANALKTTASAAPDPNSLTVTVITASTTFTELVVIILGVLVISGEYQTGMIRSSFTAAPKRLPVLWAKAILVGVTTFIISVISLWGTLFIDLPMIKNGGISPNLGNSSLWLPIFGAALSITFMALLGMGIGALARVTAGGISIAVGLVFVIPFAYQIVSNLIHATWFDNIFVFLPSNAATAFFQPTSVASVGATSGVIQLSHGGAFLVLLAWVVVAIGGAAVLMKRRDA